MKTLLGVLVAIVGAAPAFAVPVPRPTPFPVPAPELAVGGPAALAVIGAYIIARLVIRRREAAKVRSA